MRHRGFIKATVIVVLLLGGGLFASSYFFTGGNREIRPASNDGEVTFEVLRGLFVSSITETGDVESASNIEIRCRVRERGGTAIVDIVPEGTVVKKGEFLVQLDDASMRDELVEQKIRVATDRAAVIQSESDLETAKRTLKEFENGVYEQEENTLLAELALAEETLRRARDYQRYSENLARKGYVTKAQLEADRFAVLKSEKEKELAQSKLVVYRDFTKDKTRTELNSEIKKQEANLEASQYTLELSEQRLAYYEQQVAACHVTAPADGQVVYANEIDGRGDSGIVIEEGVNIREGQPIIRLPDPAKMQILTKVNDSKINAVCVGQQALIRLDTAPEDPIKGVVRKVASFPDPRRWSEAPIEYRVFVDVLEKQDRVRPGLRAKVEIFVTQIEDVVQAPVSSLVNQNDSHYVVVQKGSDLELRPVEIGANNESVVVIEQGLQPGERVLVDPDSFLEQTDFEVDSLETAEATSDG